MKILLFNDNPVVRKLVALSAQKTKDELDIVWSVEEIEESGYDLLIIDDALYSEETFESLKETVTFTASLLMATRGNAVPAGFDHVINKPFLPTDLVDLFARIDKGLASKFSEKVIDLGQESFSDDEEVPYAAISAEDSFLEIESDNNENFILDDLGDLSDDFDVSDFSQGLPPLDEEEEKFPAILDHEEVEEVRGLLKDTENDEFFQDEEISTFGIDDIEVETPERARDSDVASGAESFDFEEFDEEQEETDKLTTAEAPLIFSDESGDEEILDEDESLLDDEPLSDEALGALDLKIRQAIGNLKPDELDVEIEGTESFDFEGFDLDEEQEERDTLTAADDEETLDVPNLDSEKELDELLLEDELLSDEAFGDLEPDDLGRELDEGMEGLPSRDTEVSDITFLTEEFEGLDELDMLDERELMLAIGEEIGDESEIRVGGSEHTSLNTEALDEAVGFSSGVSSQTDMYPGESSSEGVEALQTLLKALTNEDVVKSLKGLNISININFGNDK